MNTCICYNIISPASVFAETSGVLAKAWSPGPQGPCFVQQARLGSRSICSLQNSLGLCGQHISSGFPSLPFGTHQRGRLPHCALHGDPAIRLKVLQRREPILPPTQSSHLDLLQSPPGECLIVSSLNSHHLLIPLPLTFPLSGALCWCKITCFLTRVPMMLHPHLLTSCHADHSGSEQASETCCSGGFQHLIEHLIEGMLPNVSKPQTLHL